MVIIKHSRSNTTSISTLPISSNTSCRNSYHYPIITPTIFKQILRNKIKAHPTFKIDKNYRKGKYRLWDRGYLHHQYVNWILYNMMVGIYKNWIRLAPLIIHLLTGVKKDKRTAVQQLLNRTKKQCQSVQNQLKYSQQAIRSISTTPPPNLPHPSPQQNQSLLAAIHQECTQLHYNTKLLNSNILINTRISKTQKQNILTNDLIINFNNHHNINHIQNHIINDHVEQVASTIVDRISIFKYFQSNHLTINQNLLSPFKLIFQNHSQITQQNQITTQDVIQKIFQNFHKNIRFHKYHKNLSSSQSTIYKHHVNHQQINVDCKNISKQHIKNKNKSLQDITIIPKKILDLKNLKLKKKIQLHNQHQFDINPSNLIKQPILNENSSQFKKNNLKLSYSHLPNKQSNHTSHSKTPNPQKIPIVAQNNKLRVSKLSNLPQKKKTHLRINDDINDSEQSRQKKQRQAIQFTQKTKIRSWSSIKTNKIRTRKIIQQKQQLPTYNIKKDNQSIGNIFKKQKFRKIVKSTKLKRKRQFRKTQIQFIQSNIKYQRNTDCNLSNNCNLVKKISNCQWISKNKQQHNIIKKKQCKKTASFNQHPTKQQQQANQVSKFLEIKRHCFSQDISLSSLYRLLDGDGVEKVANLILSMEDISEKPFQFLTQFNQEAVKNWMNYKFGRKSSELHQFQQRELKRFDYNLEIPIFQKEQKKQPKKHLLKDDNILSFSFSMIKNFNNNIIQQKPVNIEKQ